MSVPEKQEHNPLARVLVAPEPPACGVAGNPLARPIVEVLREHRSLLARLEAAEIDRDAYKVLAQETIHALAEITTKHTRQSKRLFRLLDKQRRSRQRSDRGPAPHERRMSAPLLHHSEIPFASHAREETPATTTTGESVGGAT